MYVKIESQRAALKLLLYRTASPALRVKKGTRYQDETKRRLYYKNRISVNTV